MFSDCVTQSSAFLPGFLSSFFHHQSCFFCINKEVGEIHPVPHPSVRDALHSVCLPAWKHRGGSQAVHRTGAGILPGTHHWKVAPKHFKTTIHIAFSGSRYEPFRPSCFSTTLHDVTTLRHYVTYVNVSYGTTCSSLRNSRRKCELFLCCTLLLLCFWCVFYGPSSPLVFFSNHFLTSVTSLA